MRTCTLIAAAMLLSTQLGCSQKSATIGVGSRIRVTQPEAVHRGSRAGLVTRAVSDTMFLRFDSGAESVAIPWSSISQLELSKGIRASTGKGAWIGLLAGTGTGLVAGFSVCYFDRTCSGDGGEEWTGVAAMAGGFVLGTTGLVVGAIIGASTKREKWDEIPSTRWRVSGTEISPGRIQLGVSHPF